MQRILQTVAFLTGLIGLAGMAGAIEAVNPSEYIATPFVLLTISAACALVCEWEGKHERKTDMDPDDAKRIIDNQRKRSGTGA